jgi:ubiquinone/menaquinone biosynthesis C-methylase UbiE
MEDYLEKTIQEYSRTAKDYEERVRDLHHKHEGEFFMASLPNAGIGRILDAGCGDGRDCRVFANRGFQITGIDLTSEFLSIAQSKVPTGYFYKMDMRRLSFPDNYFDGVWSCASIVHMDKTGIGQFLSETKRVLKKSGVLYIAAKEGAQPISHGPKTYFFYNREDIEDLIRKSGLSLISAIGGVKLMVGGKEHSEVRAFAEKRIS